MSPEICSSSEYSFASDIWMMGCCLYELVAMEKPFKGDSLTGVIMSILNDHPGEYLNRCSSFVGKLIGDCLSKDPSKRPEISEILNRLEEYKKSSELEILSDFKYRPTLLKSPSAFSSSTNEESPANSKSRPNSIFCFLEKMKNDPCTPLKKMASPVRKISRRKTHLDSPNEINEDVRLR